MCSSPALQILCESRKMSGGRGRKDTGCSSQSSQIRPPKRVRVTVIVMVMVKVRARVRPLPQNTTWSPLAFWSRLLSPATSAPGTPLPAQIFYNNFSSLPPHHQTLMLFLVPGSLRSLCGIQAWDAQLQNLTESPLVPTSGGIVNIPAACL